MPTRPEVYQAIDSERAYQDHVWGGTLSGGRTATELQPGGTRTVDEFCLYISRYANHLVEVAGTSANDEEKLEIIRKIGALSIACMEQHGAPLRGSL